MGTKPLTLFKDFSPLDIERARIMWIDAADNRTITKGGPGSISQVDDKFNTGNNVVQATGAKQPLHIGALNRLPVITFLGGQLLRKTFAAPFTQPNTIFCVYKFDPLTDTERVFDGSSGSNTHLYQIDTGDSIIANAGLSIAFNTTPKRGQARILTALFNTTASDGRIDGVDVTVGASTGSNTLGGITLGAAGFADSLFLSGFIAEFIAWNDILTFEEIRKVEKYLSKKWGILTP